MTVKTFSIPLVSWESAMDTLTLEWHCLSHGTRVWKANKPQEEVVLVWISIQQSLLKGKEQSVTVRFASRKWFEISSFDTQNAQPTRSGSLERSWSDLNFGGILPTAAVECRRQLKVWLNEFLTQKLLTILWFTFVCCVLCQLVSLFSTANNFRWTMKCWCPKKCPENFQIFPD